MTLTQQIAAYVAKKALNNAIEEKSSGNACWTRSYNMHVRWAYIARREKVPSFLP